MCGLVGSGPLIGSDYKDETANIFRTYWFPADVDVVSLMLDDDKLDLLDASNDSYVIDDYYHGLTQFYF